MREDDVRVELRALYHALEVVSDRRYPSGEENRDEALRVVRAAFEVLRDAVLVVAGSRITSGHLEAMVGAAFDRGVRSGKSQIRDQFRVLLDL